MMHLINQTMPNYTVLQMTEVEVDRMILRESEAVTLFNSVAVVVPDGTSSLVAEVLLDVRIEWSSHVFWGKKSAICLWRFMTLRFSGF